MVRGGLFMEGEAKSMCAACGVLSGAPDWMDRAGNPEGIGGSQQETRRGERQKLIKMVNILLGPGRVKISDFGEKLVIKGPTGKTKIVDSLSHVWVEADTIGLRPVDPLDEAFLETIGAAGA